MKRIVTMVLLLLLAGSATEAWSQSWVDQLGKKVKEKVKQKAEEKVLETVDKAMDKGFDKAEDAVTGKGKKKGQKTVGEEPEEIVEEVPAEPVRQPVEQPAPAPQTPQAPAMNWNKFDFVSGDEVLFDDQLANEKIGEFPSQWDLADGYAEVAEINGMKVIYGTKETRIMPYMKEKHYLPDVFTIEFDIYVPQGKRENGYMVGPEIGGNSRYDINLVGENDRNVFNLNWYHHYWEDKETNVDWEWFSGGEEKNGEINYVFKYDDFNRVSISFNQRALKVYLNETRIVNIPRCDAPKSFNIYF